MELVKPDYVNFAIKDWVIINMPQSVFYITLFVIAGILVYSSYTNYNGKKIMREVKLKTLQVQYQIETRKENLKRPNFCAACNVFMKVVKQNHTWLFHKCPKCNQEKAMHVNNHF